MEREVESNGLNVLEAGTSLSVGEARNQSRLRGNLL
jgi:hypothetical protein